MREAARESEMTDETHKFKSDIPKKAVVCRCDASLVKQLVRILVENSIKYTPEGGEIKLSLEPDEKVARLSVADEGEGIPKAVLPFVFDRFARADEARAREGGAGLGLSIAKQIAVLHKGEIEVLSREGLGSRFTFILPIV